MEFIRAQCRGGNGPDRTKLLSLHFVRDVDHKEMMEAIREALQKTAGSSYDAVAKHLESFERKLPPLRKGTRLTLAYRPGQGLHIAADGRELGVENDDAFANLLFRVWLGQNPPDTNLRAGLLGAACKP